ncbi:MAG: 2-oxoglutarate dehydrogenase E1 component [Phycisphaerae bacterium]|nr:2-oxoglutarate dehydrogenase E1 component [Phycisphaerae bacterium]
MTQRVNSVPASVNGWSPEYLEDQYRAFKSNPASVADDVRAFFQGFDLAMASPTGRGGAVAPSAEAVSEAVRVDRAAAGLVRAYRTLGHLAARLDPFGRERRRPAALDPATHGLRSSDLDTSVSTQGVVVGSGGRATLRELIAVLERAYCGAIGPEFGFVSEESEQRWLCERVERDGGRVSLDAAHKRQILEQLTRAEQFEVFLQKRYVDQKRFSLEGGESLVPLMEEIIEAAAASGVEELVIGMPHRGRLNLLNNIMGKTYEQVFTEFEDSWEDDFVDGGGDVKYHRGYSGERTVAGGRKVHLAMASNPSHLESVNAVVEGRCRAKQRLKGDAERRRVIPVLLHGDAAVIGQGVVAEVLNFSQLDGYTTGGTIHAVVNNLVGFTTGPEDARSSPYCTDLAKMVESPVFHVNGEDPEAVVAVARLAVEYRQTFRKDVFIDMWCFRKYGHNEQDEPSYTQPILAKLVKAKRSVLEGFAERLLAEGVISRQDVDEIQRRLSESLEAAQARAKTAPRGPNIDAGGKRWKGMGGEYSHAPIETGVPMQMLREVCGALGRAPEGFNVNPKLKKLMADRAAICTQGPITYADGEQFAIGTLLLEGHGVRLSGQDARRGTFSHRHAVLRDFVTGEAYTPLNHMRPLAEIPDEAGKTNRQGALTQGRFCVYDSPLSEYSVMGFDYGYSLGDPGMLVMWEAQFGDFCNTAQVMIDQYLASAELKWDRWSGLVLLLPHGYEGAGPEHSSARLERFLALCADDNMQVVNPTTGSQIFHLLRRQVRRDFRKPLIVMTPKGMLREPTARVEDLTRGSFMDVLDDPAMSGPPEREAVKRLILCCGKIYHEMSARRSLLGKNDVAMVRIEQLYPFNTSLAKDIISRYPTNAERVWVQEEPRNAGAYMFMRDVLRTEMGIEVSYIGRQPSASPATGSKHKHKEEQEAILAAAIGGRPGESKTHTNGSHGQAAPTGRKPTAKR